ncbi:uncharacterized protein LOC115442845 isoform X2 [Manduca sexta]|uniref:uncharacterized protein LOC115442845 isoform X2 n=1 Tax=Manduca sexta TaxID=7130 RepID=UPI00118275F5|nr:uncharacterized protein LOC115442845 isoform X2 [Manduca sexta]
MMNLSKYSRNYILCGDFDYHCLLCNETFHLTADTEKHIRWEKHRNNIKNQTQLPKFINDSISKITNFYYCGICNTVINGMKSVKLHIKNEKHKNLKSNPDSLTREPIGQYAYDYIELNREKITINTWNGVIAKKCIICNSTADDFSKHIKEQGHLIKLIQSEIVKSDGQYYRKINEDSFQCFTCKKVFLNDIFPEHSKKHVKNSENSIKQPGLTVSNSTWDELDLDGKIIIDMHRDVYSIDMKNKKAICKICQDIVHPARRHFDLHLNMHLKSDGKDGIKPASEFLIEPKDHGKRRSELAKYGRENYIKLNEGGKMGFCTLCDKKLSPHLCVFVEHVKGFRHTSHLKLKRMEHEKSTYKTFPLKKFISSLNYCKNLEMFRINTDYLIFKYGLLFLKEINFGSNKHLKCYACGDVYPSTEKYEHCKTTQHKTNFLAAKFIANNDDIILREIRQNLYHCGLCNEVLPFSKSLEKHLKSQSHMALMYKTTTLRPAIDAQQYYYQTLNFESLSTDVNDDSLYSKIMKAVYE